MYLLMTAKNQYHPALGPSDLRFNTGLILRNATWNKLSKFLAYAQFKLILDTHIVTSYFKIYPWKPLPTYFNPFPLHIELLLC